MWIRCALCFVLVASLWVGCATNPVTGRSELQLVSESQEIAIGSEQYPWQVQMAGGPYLLDPELSEYVNRVGHKLAAVSERPHLPFEFVIVNDGSWNAWALPGGKIALNRGLLEAMRNESELAAVLGHEIVHATARHSAKQMEREIWMQAGVMGLTLAVEADMQDLVMQTGSIAAGITHLSYSREAEREADHYGIRGMVRAGYDPGGAVTLQELFAENQESAGGWLSSHPASVERVRRNRDALASHAGGGYVGEAEYRIRTLKLRERAPAYLLYEEGLKALKAGKAEEALRLSLNARRQLPEEALFYALSAEAHLKMNQPAEALRALDAAVARNGEWFWFWLKRGELHEKRGNRRQAQEDYRRSYELLPSGPAREGFQRVSSGG